MFFFFFNDTATTEIYTLSLHDALPICALLAFFSGASTVGFKSRGQWRHFGFDRVVEHSLECHESENFGRLLGRKKVEPVGKGPSGEIGRAHV